MWGEEVMLRVECSSLLLTKPTVHVSPSQTAEGDDGFVYFNATGSGAPETASKGELLTRGWQGR